MKTIAALAIAATTLLGASGAQAFDTHRHTEFFGPNGGTASVDVYRHCEGLGFEPETQLYFNCVFERQVAGPNGNAWTASGGTQLVGPGLIESSRTYVGPKGGVAGRDSTITFRR